MLTFIVLIGLGVGAYFLFKSKNGAPVVTQGTLTFSDIDETSYFKQPWFEVFPEHGRARIQYKWNVTSIVKSDTLKIVVFRGTYKGPEHMPQQGRYVIGQEYDFEAEDKIEVRESAFDAADYDYRSTGQNMGYIKTTYKKEKGHTIVILKPTGHMRPIAEFQIVGAEILAANAAADLRLAITAFRDHAPAPAEHTPSLAGFDV